MFSLTEQVNDIVYKKLSYPPPTLITFLFSFIYNEIFKRTASWLLRGLKCWVFLLQRFTLHHSSTHNITPNTFNSLVSMSHYYGAIKLCAGNIDWHFTCQDSAITKAIKTLAVVRQEVSVRCSIVTFSWLHILLL